MNNCKEMFQNNTVAGMLISVVLFSLVLNESQLPLVTVFPNLIHAHSVVGSLGYRTWL